MPGVRSVAFGIWVGVGSRDERPSLHGASHFLEHLLFKGTSRRDALEISSQMDAVGGEMNAFTDKEYTCYYARLLAEDLPLAVDVLSDMVLSSLVLAEDVEVERGVILEEIAMHDDDPADAVHDAFAAALFGDSPLGRPVIGTVESIEGLSRSAIAGFYRRRYALPQMVVAAAGGVQHDHLLELVQEAFADRLTGDAAPAPLRGAGRKVPTYSRVSHGARPSEQTNLVLGTTGLPRDDPRRFALSVLSGAVGGGMSSRLFQSVREERGLAYSVYSYASGAADAGQFAVYAGCAPGKVGEVLGLVSAELAEVAEHGLRPEEVRRSVGNLRGQLVLGLEDTGSRMTRLGKGELVHARPLSPQQVLDCLDAVTVEDVSAVARDVLTRPRTLAVIGPVDGADLEGALA
jgi:predicted Zn-dependent peptidase